MCLSFLYPLGQLIRGLVEEKETRARELMRISGLRGWPLPAAWAVTYVLLYVVVVLVSAAVLRPAVFPNSDFALLAAFLFCFALSSVPLGFLISCFFSRARLASIFGPFGLFALVLPRYIFFSSTRNQALGAKRVCCLLAPAAFTFGADRLGAMEGGNTGVNWDNYWSGPLSVGETMAWMILDTGAGGGRLTCHAETRSAVAGF